MPAQGQYWLVLDGSTHPVRTNQYRKSVIIPVLCQYWLSIRLKYWLSVWFKYWLSSKGMSVYAQYRLVLAGRTQPVLLKGYHPRIMPVQSSIFWNIQIPLKISKCLKLFFFINRIQNFQKNLWGYLKYFWNILDYSKVFLTVKNQFFSCFKNVYCFKSQLPRNSFIKVGLIWKLK